MEKNKYLEPHFSKYVAPIVKYCIQRYNLGSSVFTVSNITAGINDNHSAMMDIVPEQDLESTKKFKGESRKNLIDSNHKSNYEETLTKIGVAQLETNFVNMGNIKSSRSEQKKKSDFYNTTTTYQGEREFPNNNQDIQIV